MTPMIPKSVLNQYAIGQITCIVPITHGLIHKTFVVKTPRKQYIMQRLHPALSSEEIAQDFFAVTQHLQKENFFAPKCILTKKRTILARQGKHVWRLQTKLPGKSVERLNDLPMATQAAELYGRFHKVMDRITHEFRSKKMLHETEKIYDKFLATMETYAGDPIVSEVQDEIAFIKQELPKYFLPTSLPQRVIHGDPKISNLLFIRNHAQAIIDLDTCNRHTILVELGDAFRSWCGKQEDHPQNIFSLSLFKAAWKGYQKGTKGFLTKREISLIPSAIGTITLELATRFLTDYFEDTYFGWDELRYTNRRAHNLARLRGQLSEFRDYQKKLPVIERMVLK